MLSSGTYSCRMWHRESIILFLKAKVITALIQKDVSNASDIFHINHRFFICIDSDLRLLRKEEGLTSGNFVAQTYAYSWENHHCAAGLLQHRFVDAVPDTEFDFEVFLGELSRAIYVPLQLLVYCKTPELNTIWNIGKFNKCIPLQPSR